MAELNEVLVKKISDAIVKLNNDLISLDATYSKMLSSVEGANKAFQNKAATTKTVSAAEKLLADEQKRLTAIEKEAENSAKALDRQRQKGLQAMAKAEAKERELSKAINMEVKSEDDLIRKTNALVQARRKLDTTTDSGKQKHKALTAEINKNTIALKESDSQIGRSQRNVGNYGSALKGLGSQFLGALGLTSLIVGFVGAIKNAINVGKEFEKSLSSLSAITGATGQDLDFLKNKALELSKTSLMSANGIVKAFELVGSIRPELLADGEALAEVTKQAIILSEATGGKLGIEEAARATAGTLNQFSKASSEAGDVVNILAAGSKFGAAAVLDITKSIDKFGAVADAANVPLEQSVGLIETLAEKSIVGEEAGTKLRNMLIILQGDSKNFKNGVFDVNLALENLANENLNVTDLTQKFGRETVVAAQILIKGRQKVIDYTAAVTGTSTALEQQSIQSDNLAGSITKLSNSWDTFMISANASGGFLKGLVDWSSMVVAGFGLIGKGFKQISLDATQLANKNIFAQQLLDDKKAVDDLSRSLKQKGFTEEEANKRAISAIIVQTIKLREMADNPVPFQVRINALRELAEKEVAVVEETTKVKTETEISAEEKLQKELFEIRKSFATNTELYLIEKTALENMAAYALLSEEEKQKALFKIKEKYQLDGIAAEQAYFETILAAAQKKSDGIKVINEIETDDADEFIKERDAQNEESYEKELKQEEIKAAIKQKKWELASELGNALFEFGNQKREAELESIKQKESAEIAEIDRKNEAGLLSDEEAKKQKQAVTDKYAKQERALKIKQAVADKKQAMFNIALSTAMAITKASPIVPLMAFAAAIGAVQLAVAASKPIPKFKKGTKGKHNTPDSFITSEKGAGTEWIENKGKLIQTTKPTLFSGMEGSRVYSNPEVNAIVNKAGGHSPKNQIELDALINTVSLTGKETVNAIRNIKTFILDDERKVYGFKQGNYKRTYLN